LSFLKRWCQHKSALYNNRHKSRHLQNAWNLYGEKSFIFSVVEEVVPNVVELLQREQHWLDFYKSYLPHNGYNTRTIANSMLGTKRTPEICEKLKLAFKNRGSNFKGKHHTAYSKKLISIAKKGHRCNVGRKVSESTLKNMSIARKLWIVRNPEKWAMLKAKLCKNGRIPWNKGLTKATSPILLGACKKQSEAKLGKPSPKKGKIYTWAGN
jgi:group I intron endonuclease